MKTWIYILIIAAILLAIYLYKKGKLSVIGLGDNSIASCIKKSGAKFYGASWCSHCNAQKQLFGPSAKYLPYVECSGADHKLKQECASLGIQGFPTWVFANGEKVSGGLSIAQLKVKTGC